MKSIEEIFACVRATLTLFKTVPNLAGEKFPAYTLDNTRNLKHGIFVTEEAFKVCPCIAGKSFFKFMTGKFGYDVFELNRGFYKSFKTVADSTPERLLLNKLLHYMTTYGAENLGTFDRERVYIPNDALDLPADAKPVKITVIDALSDAEIEARTLKLINSGAALTAETVDNLVAVAKFLRLDLNVDDVPNKELAARLCELLNILPADPVKFLRLMIYLATNSALLIKSSETLDAVKNSRRDFDKYFSAYIKQNGLGKLASVFHRFKPLWLAFKPHSAYLKSTINKTRKLADHCHKPVAPKFLERLTAAQDVDLARLKSELAQITPYKKAALANAIRYRRAAPDNILYTIRNGKVFVEEYFGTLKFDVQKILDAILESLAEDIRPNVDGKRVYIPAHFNYAVPVSEKNFVGNIPAGSSHAFLGKAAIVGVHWFNIIVDGHENRTDLDLHLNSSKIDIGWQNDFEDENFLNAAEHKVIFSGDMTDAPLESGGATEAFFIGERLTDELLTVNLNYYNRVAGESVPFKLILGDVAQAALDRQYLIASHEVAFCVPSAISSGEMFLGFLDSDAVGGKKFYFSAGSVGDRRVAKSDKFTEQIISARRTTFESALSLREVLIGGGAILASVTSADCDINLDPAEVTKDVLLGLFARA